MSAQETVYCGKRHRTSDGVPVEHACRVLLPEFLEAELRREWERAVEVLEAMPIVLHAGIDSVPGRASTPPRAAPPPRPDGRRRAPGARDVTEPARARRRDAAPRCSPPRGGIEP